MVSKQPSENLNHYPYSNGMNNYLSPSETPCQNQIKTVFAEEGEKTHIQKTPVIATS